MGVDWLSCKSCGKTFPDCGYYISCECGEHWCSDACAEVGGYELDKCKLGYEVLDGYEQNEECNKSNEGYCEDCNDLIIGGCKYCREEDFEDGILLEHAMKLLNMTREDFIRCYKNR